MTGHFLLRFLPLGKYPFCVRSTMFLASVKLRGIFSAGKTVAIAGFRFYSFSSISPRTSILLLNKLS